MHLSVAGGLLRAARRARQIGATALQIFSDNPTAWRRRPGPPIDAAPFVAYCERHGIAPVVIHASYLINLAGSTEPFARQSLAGLNVEMQRSPGWGATLVNTHIGSHFGAGPETGIRRIGEVVGPSWRRLPRESGWSWRTRQAAAELWARGSKSWRRSSAPSGHLRRSSPSAWTRLTCGLRATTSPPQMGQPRCLTDSTS
jgi:hypothetical protein